MPEENVLNLSYLGSELSQALLVLERPVVQLQIVAIAFSIVSASLISKEIWRQVRLKWPNLNDIEFNDLRISKKQYFIALIRHLLTPSLSILIVNAIRLLFEQQGWFAGYLTDSRKLLWYSWFYGLFLTSIYALFPVNTVSRYHQRFFAPLFVLLIIGIILSWFFNLQKVSQVTVVELFNESITLGSAFIGLAGLYFWIVGTSLVEKLLFHIFLDRKVQDARFRQVISLILRYVLIGLGLTLIFGYVGISTTALAAITGGLSVGIGFGLREVVSNFVSGLWLLFEGALKPGDIITIDRKMSRVKKLGIRATTVQVIGDNSEEIIPNQTFFTESVSTLTGSDAYVRRSLQVGASYQCDPTKVADILLQVAQQHPHVLQDPPPVVFSLGFGESSIDFELKFWLDDPLMSSPVTTELVFAIWQAFAENGIEIPYPQRDLHIRSNMTKEQNFEDN
ncbi:MAG: mechanosensitive ion channel family protein [Microcystaceae cyanobacterium]